MLTGRFEPESTDGGGKTCTRVHHPNGVWSERACRTKSECVNSNGRLCAAYAAALAVIAFGGRAYAEVVTGPCAAVTDPNNAPSTDPRIEHLIVDGVHVNVLLPPGYHHGDRRYPTVYLFHGAFSDEDSFSTQTDLLAFTAGLNDEDQAIAVMPDGGYLPAGRDWVDGTHPQEGYVVGTLIPYIDAHYRSLGDRSHRAAAGFSAGGLDAMVFAARHPDMFVAAGSFSGFVDPIEPLGIQVVTQFAELDDSLCGASVNWLDIWGDPMAHPMGWLGHDPTDLALSLKDISLYIGSDNGVACSDNPNPDPFLVFAETVVYQMSQALDQALSVAGAAHVAEFLSCGVHEFSNADHDLRRFWPQMLAAFGAPLPAEFDYRTGDASASVWGWTFTADPTRAPEFLDVRGASNRGVRLTGSGVQSVVTAPLFRRGQIVRISGAALVPLIVRADGDGRVGFNVDLGPAHSLEQGTAEELTVAASNPNYFVTRAVRFEPLHERDGEER
jgi:S-formylglutathione hydrolase FrmB